MPFLSNISLKITVDTSSHEEDQRRKSLQEEARQYYQSKTLVLSVKDSVYGFIQISCS
jgi:hypothetical protein